MLFCVMLFTDDIYLKGNKTKYEQITSFLSIDFGLCRSINVMIGSLPALINHNKIKNNLSEWLIKQIVFVPLWFVSNLLFGLGCADRDSRESVARG